MLVKHLVGSKHLTTHVTNRKIFCSFFDRTLSDPHIASVIMRKA